MMTAKKTIAVDLDEVLGAFLHPLCEFHNEEYGTSLTQQDFHSYAFKEVWGGTRDDSVKKVHKFFESKYFEDIPRIPGAFAGVKTLQDNGFDLVLVTSRQHAIEEKTKLWVERHFPNIFREMAFGNHWGMDGGKVSKPDMCKGLNASVLIDDSLIYAEQVAEVGIQALLFDLDGAYGWNKPTTKSKPNDRIKRVRGWDEVVKFLLHNQ